MLSDSKNCVFLKVPMVTTESGLQYKDIKVGSGPSPPIGFQVCIRISQVTAIKSHCC